MKKNSTIVKMGDKTIISILKLFAYLSKAMSPISTRSSNTIHMHNRLMNIGLSSDGSSLYASQLKFHQVTRFGHVRSRKLSAAPWLGRPVLSW